MPRIPVTVVDAADLSSPLAPLPDRPVLLRESRRLLGKPHLDVRSLPPRLRRSAPRRPGPARSGPDCRGTEDAGPQLSRRRGAIPRRRRRLRRGAPRRSERRVRVVVVVEVVLERRVRIERGGRRVRADGRGAGDDGGPRPVNRSTRLAARGGRDEPSRRAHLRPRHRRQRRRRPHPRIPTRPPRERARRAHLPSPSAAAAEAGADWRAALLDADARVVPGESSAAVGSFLGAADVPNPARTEGDATLRAGGGGGGAPPEDVDRLAHPESTSRARDEPASSSALVASETRRARALRQLRQTLRDDRREGREVSGGRRRNTAPSGSPSGSTRTVNACRPGPTPPPDVRVLEGDEALLAENRRRDQFAQRDVARFVGGRPSPGASATAGSRSKRRHRQRRRRTRLRVV